MTISLNAACTNSTGVTLTFSPGDAIHGTNPVSDLSMLPDQDVATVMAYPIDSTYGPSPDGTFNWSLPGNAAQFTFAYNLHATPISFYATNVPAGYSVTNCSLDASGNAQATLIAVS